MNLNLPAEGSFDPEEVIRLLREELARGHRPAVLLLGHREAAAWREMSSMSSGVSPRFFMGLEVVEGNSETGVALLGDKGAWEG